MDWNMTEKATGSASLPGSFCRFSLLLEVLMPYVPFMMRQPLLLFSKFFECMECLKCPKSRFSHVPYQNSSSPAEQLSDVFSRLSPFLSESDRQKFSQMQNMMQMMNMYQMMQSMSSFFEQGPADGASEHSDAGFPNSEANSSADSSTVFTKDNTSDTSSGFASDSASTAFSGSMPDFSSLDPAALLSALSPEQQQMFEMMKGMMNGNN